MCAIPLFELLLLPPAASQAKPNRAEPDLRELDNNSKAPPTTISIRSSHAQTQLKFTSASVRDGSQQGAECLPRRHPNPQPHLNNNRSVHSKSAASPRCTSFRPSPLDTLQRHMPGRAIQSYLSFTPVNTSLPSSPPQKQEKEKKKPSSSLHTRASRARYTPPSKSAAYCIQKSDFSAPTSLNFFHSKFPKGTQQSSAPFKPRLSQFITIIPSTYRVRFISVRYVTEAISLK